jgi:16S rRNA (adenine1518-N6/adenine1519-N6)-dimethyltransferase
MSARRDQHFLVDSRAIARICDALRQSDRLVLEIGPGEGALTRGLLDRGARVNAVEIDPGLVEFLKRRFYDDIARGRLTVFQGDAVRCPLPPFQAVVSNLPYSASSKITFRLLAAGFEEAILVYQEEFADRMAAPPGTPACGRLSVMVQTYCTVERLFDIPPHSFSPPPPVRSAVVRLTPRGPLFPINSPEAYANTVRALFSHRRKTVRNALRSAKGILPPAKIMTLLAELPGEILVSRPEELYLEDFATIANLIAP